MKNFLNKYKYQVTLLFIACLIFWTNYKSGTYLSGWDNLQTELNPGLAVKRAFFSVWEEYQSFGLTAGMAHSADLVRAGFLWFVSFALPQNIVRYFYHFLMLFLGGFGAFKLFTTFSKNKVTSFLGSLFYMLNFGTVQIFYLPFEPFSTFFAFLPWGIWAFANITLSKERGTYKKDLLLFLLINFLGTPAFYTQQLFIVYILILICICLSTLKTIFSKKLFFCFSLILIVNSFWLLPQLYYLKTSNNWISDAKINQIATQDTFYQNLEKGTLSNFLTLKGFYFDLLDARNQPLFSFWKTHYAGIFAALAWVFAGLVILGLISQVKKKNYSFFFTFLLCALALLPSTIPFSWLNIFLRRSSLINQIFRSPFTKFIIPYSLVFSYFFAEGLATINKKFLSLIFLVLIFFYSLPSFQGYFISPAMRIKIPTDYLKVMEYLKNEDKNQRIALLPDYTYWGWFMNKWGYNGSGFLWYGIEQPIISRTFDVWSPVSESYFWEQKQALEAENIIKFEAVLDKYDIGYILLDYSLKPVAATYKSLQYDRIDNLLSKSKKIVPVIKMGQLALFKVSHPVGIKDFISTSSKLPNIGPEIKLTSEDTAYFDNGAYQTDENKSYNLYYPFLDLTTQTKNRDKKWSIGEFDNQFFIGTELDENLPNKNLDMQASSEATLYNEGKTIKYNFNLSKNWSNNSLTINFEKNLVKTFDINNPNKNNNELGFTADNLDQKYSYLVHVKTKNIKGVPFFFYIVDGTKKQSVTEEILTNEDEYFILPPKFEHGVGYSFIFQNRDYENYSSKNKIKELSIYLFPYETLKQTKIINKNSNSVIFYDDFYAKKNNYFAYQIKTSAETIILNQAYDPGWMAISDGKFLEHVKINNWANGWVLPTSNHQSLVTIIFWPQYLEFLGFALLIIAFLIIIFKYDSTLPPADKKS